MKESEKKLLTVLVSGLAALAFTKGFLWAWSEDKADQRHAELKQIIKPSKAPKLTGALAQVGKPSKKKAA